jgi:outer membrane protein TolC
MKTFHFWSRYFLLLVLATAEVVSAQNTTLPQAPPQTPAQQVPAPGRPRTPSVTISLDDAIELAKKNNPTLQAQQTLISQNQEQEVTANLRPNPTLTWDAQYIPIFTPDLFSSSYIDNTAEFDVGIGYLFERGHTRQHRLEAA